MADYEDASVAALREVFGEVNVSGCWFHFGQAIIKRVNKIGLKDAYTNEPDVTKVVQSLLGLPLLPASEIVLGWQDVTSSIDGDGQFARQLRQLVAYVKKQCFCQYGIY